MLDVAVISSRSLLGITNLVESFAVFGNEDGIILIALADGPFMDCDAAYLGRFCEFD